MKRITFTKIVAASIGCGMALITASAPAGLYKWIDENGDVQYSDSIPPDQISNEHKELNDHGVTVNKVGRAKSAEELAAEKTHKDDEKRRAAEMSEQTAKQGVYDRMLLDTYLTEQDLIVARDRKLTAIDGTIQITERSRQSAEASLKAFEHDAKDSAEGSKERDRAQQRLEEARAQVADLDKFIAARRKEQDEIRAKFEKDLTRFRELKGPSL